MNPRKGLLLLSFIFFCRTVGFLLFSKGFLLNRVVIPDYSVCTNGASDSHEGHFAHTCDGQPRLFKRVVWLLIDALRYDFIVYDPDLDPSPPPYRNKMPFVRDLLRDQPQHARLFKLMVDPPTTTMQRLKALTTGGLPTFIDISSNFNSHEILEDSLLHQAKASGRNVTFIGDDTWLGLYPRLLTKAFDYPSLNVKDLHTVDDGVVANLVPELRKYDADFIVGHFLGVDHVGHTYGPTHPTMAEKLLQLNDVLRSTFASLDEDTIVLVLGDHGMTETGDHGGEGPLETEAGLLIYSKRPIFDQWQGLPRSIHQIDLVPTTAMMLGMPIPYSNLGMVIPEVFLPPLPPSKLPPALNATGGFEGRVTLDFLNLVANNSEQIQKYLRAYQQYAGGDFPVTLLDDLETQLAEARALHIKAHLHGNQAELTATAFAYIHYMDLARTMCQGVWAKFDDSSINGGMIVLFATLCFNFAMAVLRTNRGSHPTESFVAVGFAGTVIVAMVLFGTGIELLVSFAFYSLIFCTLVVLCSTAYSRLRSVLQRPFPNLVTLLSSSWWVQMAAALAALLHSMSLLSNSFILYEGDTLTFLLQSLLAVLFIHASRKVASQSSTMRLSEMLTTVILPFLVLGAVVRVAKVFFTCRDLQVGCMDTTLTAPLSVLPRPLELSSAARFIVSCVLMCAVPLCLYRCVPEACYGYLSLPLRLLGRFGLPLAGLGTCATWALEGLLQGWPGLTLPSWGRVLLPRAVCITCAVTVLACVVKPYRTSKAAISKVVVPSSRAVSTAVLLILIVSVWIPATLVLNDGVGLSSALMVIQAAVLLWVFVNLDLQGSRWPLVIVWGLMSCQYFYCLGHTPTVTSLRFEAAFTVIDGNISGLNLIAAGIVVALNTLASQVLFALGLPFLVLLGRDHTEPMSCQLLAVSLQYTAFHSLKMMVTVSAASLHRRHLMIWGVFSPRFIYEAAFQATTDLCVLLMYALLTIGPLNHFKTE